MRRLALLLFVIFMSVTWVYGQESIHTNACTVPTANWTFVNGGTSAAIQQSGYWLVDDTGDFITSEPFDVRNYSDLTLTFQVATYGSGTNHSCLVQVSFDNGSSWETTSFTSSTPTASSPYISAGTWSLGTINTEFLKFRWSIPSGGAKGVRIKDISFMGILTTVNPEPTNHVTNFDSTLDTPPYSTITLTWTDATGGQVPDAYLIKGSSVGYSSIADPIDAEPEDDSALVMNVSKLEEMTSFINLDPDTIYYFKIYPCTNSGVNIDYKINGTVPQTSIRTARAIPLAPVATAATAISHEGFTARWNASNGADGYYIDVQSGSPLVASDLLITEYVEGSSNNKYLEIFNGTGTAVDLSGYYLRLMPNGEAEGGANYVNNQLSGTLENGACIVYKNSAAALTLPGGVTAITNSAVNFNGDDAIALWNSNTSSYADIFGRIGNDPGTAWTGSGGYTTLDKTLVRLNTVTNGVTTSPTGTGPSAFVTLTTEWTMYNQNVVSNLGSHSFAENVSYHTGYENLEVQGTAVRVSNLDPETEYSFVVRAYNTSGSSPNSNTISVESTPVTDGVSANTVFDGDPITVLVPPVTGEGAPTFTNSDVIIDPANSNSGDVSVTMEWTPDGFETEEFARLICRITTSDNTLLNGTITINHEGLGYTTLSLAQKWESVWRIIDSANFTATEDYTEVTLSGFENGGKGELIIAFDDGNHTLPVELSYFNAALSAQNYVNLMWITQSETGVSGYYVYRNDSEDLNNADLISPLIAASNTSQQQSYIFTDSSLTDDGTYYYWLQNVDLDGGNHYWGPVIFLYSIHGDSGTPNVPLVTELKSIYPNPFNPLTNISYGLKEAVPASISIYNTRGQLVRTISSIPATAGNHRVEWNGKDDNGSDCTSGLYFFRLTAGTKTFTQKAVLIK